jgi:hypothetical protein
MKGPNGAAELVWLCASEPGEERRFRVGDVRSGIIESLDRQDGSICLPITLSDATHS